MTAFANSFNVETHDWPVAAGIMAGAMQGVAGQQLAAAGVLAAAQIAAAEMQGDKNIEMVRQQRDWIEGQHNKYRDWSMGGQENTVRSAYVQYIGSFTRTYSQMIGVGEGNIAKLQTAITGSDEILNKLYDNSLRNDRLTFVQDLRNKQITDAGTDSDNKITSVIEINRANTELAQAKENAINIAYKEEFSRIDSEEAKRGYVGGDGFRDKLLTQSRLKQQDDIAINNKGTDLENTDRLEKVKIDLSDRDFQLSEGDRGRQFNVYEDDVDKKLTLVPAAGEKVIQNNNVEGDAPEDLANRAFVRRHERKPFSLQNSPPNSSPVAEVESTGAVAAAALGNLVSGGIRRGVQARQGFGSGVNSGNLSSFF